MCAEGFDALVCWRRRVRDTQQFITICLFSRFHWDAIGAPRSFNVCGDSCSLPSARTFSSRSLWSAFRISILPLTSRRLCVVRWKMRCHTKYTTKTTTNLIAKENNKKKKLFTFFAWQREFYFVVWWKINNIGILSNFKIGLCLYLFTSHCATLSRHSGDRTQRR